MSSPPPISASVDIVLSWLVVGPKHRSQPAPFQDASRGCARALPRRLLSAFGALRSRCLSRPIPVTASGVGRLRDRLRTTRTPFVPSCGAEHRTRLIVLGCLMVWSALCPCIACRKRRQRCVRKEETSTWASVESYSLQPSH